ncbi:hypothetical protein N7466_001837 [Penicillium verhagenii]|uniref:uncharacterized protein n=1 Tax=Penicillium verhagenii TaxID=1562060 RepID=UPI0025450A62|nr:uncharacterized protein N7466_001837 [Penicillium verhagenii]KAJ5938703.1 hypothetical protein N7466_001837 [Penicillium verhagenii]
MVEEGDEEGGEDEKREEEEVEEVEEEEPEEWEAGESELEDASLSCFLSTFILLEMDLYLDMDSSRPFTVQILLPFWIL